MRPNIRFAGVTGAAVIAALGLGFQPVQAQTGKTAPEIVNPFKGDTESGVQISEAGVLYSDGSNQVDSAVTGEYSLKLNPGSNGNVVIADMEGTPVLSAKPKGSLYADLPPGEYQISGDGDSCEKVAIRAGSSQSSVSLGNASNCEGAAAPAQTAANASQGSEDGDAGSSDEYDEDIEVVEEESASEPAPQAASSGTSSSAASGNASSGSATATASASKPAAKPAPKPKPKQLRFYDRDKANPPGVDIAKQTSEAGVEYVTGGIGRRETAFMQSEFGNYSFMLTNTSMSDGRKAHVADVTVNVTNAAGEQVLDVVTQGPGLLAQLKPGKYSMTTEFEGATREQSFVVGRRGQQKIDIHWPTADLGLSKSDESKDD
jgi:hypothetical protein